MKSAIFVVSILLANSALAGGWTPPQTITSAFVEDSDAVVVYTSDQAGYTPGCGGGTWIFRIASTEPRRARVWATILAAIATEKKISFWYGDSCASWGYHEFTAVRIIP